MKGKCKVCNDSESKYKCPSCLILYCSLGCYKIHKAICESKKATEIPKQDSRKTKLNQECGELEEGEIDDDDDDGGGGVDECNVDAEDKIPKNLLEKLGNSKELRNLLVNKHLRQMLQEIDNDADPGGKLDKAMQIPIFTEFVETCLGIVEPNKERSIRI